METHDRHRGWNWKQLAVLPLFAGLFLAMVIPALLSAQEAARRTSCVCNGKQVGLAIQNFHDIRGEICPSYLTDDQSPAAAPRDYAAWPVLLLPYLEQHSIYEMVDLRHPLSTNVARHAEFRTMPMPVYFCKSRRPPEGITRNGAGAVGDKATISRCDLGPGVVPDEPRTWDGAMLVCRAFNSSAETADVDGVTLKPGEFRSVTNFASVIDGLSNTIFIADKAVHRDRMGGHPTDSARTIEAGEQDGTYYYGGLGMPHRPGDLLAPGAIAYWSRRLAPDPRSGRSWPADAERTRETVLAVRIQAFCSRFWGTGACESFTLPPRTMFCSAMDAATTGEFSICREKPK